MDEAAAARALTLELGQVFTYFFVPEACRRCKQPLPEPIGRRRCHPS